MSSSGYTRGLYGLFAFLIFVHCVCAFGPFVLRWCGLTVESVATGVSEWFAGYRTAARQRRIDVQTVRLPQVDRVVVYSLGPIDTELTDGFPIRPYNFLMSILNSKTVIGEQAEHLAALWRSREFKTGHAICHEPPYGLRFYSRGTLVCETSICWMCGNCCIGHDGTGFFDKNEALLDHLQTIVALPVETQALIAIQRAERAMLFDELATAQEHLRQALHLAPDSMRALLLQGRIFARENDAKAAASSYSRIIALYPDDAAGYWERGELLARQGEYAPAIEDIELAIVNADEHTPLGHYGRSPTDYLGLLYLAHGDVDYGLDRLREAHGPLPEIWFRHYINCFVRDEQMFGPPRSCLTTDMDIYCDALSQLQTHHTSVLYNGIASPDSRLRLAISADEEEIDWLALEVRNQEGAVLWKHVAPVRFFNPWRIDWGKNNSIWLATEEKLIQFVATAPGHWSVVEYHDPNELPTSFMPFYDSASARVVFVQP